MSRIMTITLSALMLAGCAGNYDKLADANVCEPSMPASQSVASQFFPSSALAVPTRSLLGSGKTDSDDTITYACIDATNNKTNAPKVPNLHKIRLDHLSAAT
jgi:PBP1b-binding outer membrane lipoprotein LpoB